MSYTSHKAPSIADEGKLAKGDGSTAAVTAAKVVSQIEDNNVADIDNKANFEQFMHDLLMDKDSNGGNEDKDHIPPQPQFNKNVSLSLAPVKEGSDTTKAKYNYPLIIATGNASGQNNTSPGNVYLLQPKSTNRAHGQLNLKQASPNPNPEGK